MLLSKVTYSAFSLYNFVSMCVPWELNPQPFALLRQCSTTEPQEQEMQNPLVFLNSPLQPTFLCSIDMPSHLDFFLLFELERYCLHLFSFDDQITSSFKMTYPISARKMCTLFYMPRHRVASSSSIYALIWMQTVHHCGPAKTEDCTHFAARG